MQVEGYENLVEMYFNATASNRSLKVPGDDSQGFCGEVPQDSMHLFRGQDSDLPWSGVIILDRNR